MVIDWRSEDRVTWQQVAQCMEGFMYDRHIRCRKTPVEGSLRDGTPVFKKAPLAFSILSVITSLSGSLAN